MRKKKKELKDVLFDIYRELYSKSTPSADFDELYETAPLDEMGRKVIDFTSYEIDGDLMDEIIKKHCKENRLRKIEINSIRFNVYLGCSPKTRRKEIAK